MVRMSLMVCVVASVASAGTLSFSDQSAAAGLLVVQDLSGSPYPFGGAMFAGGCVGDFDRDGAVDVFVPSDGTTPDLLYLNDGAGKFTDHGAAWGLTERHYGVGAAVGDFDADGFLDIFVTSHGDLFGGFNPGQHRLYRNTGTGFVEVAADAGVATTSQFIGDGLGASFGDYDLDGDLDLAVAGWINNNNGNRLFRNNGDGTFTDVTGIVIDVPSLMQGFSPRFTDMDGDRFPELLWVSDFGTSQYYVNLGDGTFENRTVQAGVGLDQNGMGTTIGDFNADGRLDWYVTSIHEDDGEKFGNTLYLNQGDHLYVEAAQASGVDDGGWGWGTVAVDLDHDTDVDIVETNGWFSGGEWVGETSKVFLNDGAGAFTEEAVARGLVHTGYGRGIANFDADSDGDQDILIFANGEEPSLFRNDLSGPDVHWLRILFDTSSDASLAPDGFGVCVFVDAGGVVQQRQVDGGCNYLSVSGLSAHFGLGESEDVDEVRIVWPSGRLTTLRGVAADQVLVVEPIFIEGDTDGDGSVDFMDLNRVLDNWSGSVPVWREGDTNGDGLVDFADLEHVLSGWGGN